MLTDQKKGSHCVYSIQVNLIWSTKYRKPVLCGTEAVRIRELIRDICKELNVEIMKGKVAQDYVHLLVSMPPTISIAKMIQIIKGKSANKIFNESETLRTLLPNRALWSRGYCATTCSKTEDIKSAYFDENEELTEEFHL